MAKPIFGLGTLLLIVLVTVGGLDARQQIGTFLVLVLVAALAYLAVLWVIHTRPPGTSKELVVCLGLGLAWRLALLGGVPLVSDDVYRYVWDGRVQQRGLNPYETVPADPALASLHTELTRRIDPTNAALPTIYPPLAQYFFLGVTTVHESVEAVALAVIVADVLIVVLLWRWLLTAGRNRWWVLAYAWHPLVALEGAGGGHIDVVGTLLLVAGGYALSRRRSLLAAVALAGAFAVKFLPVVLVPLLWRRVRLTHALAGLAFVVLLYVPFMQGGQLPVGSLATYAAQWRFNAPLFRVMEPVFGMPALVGLAVAAGLAVAVRARRTLDRDDPAAWAWPMAVAVGLMPAIYPWYLVWLTPFLTGLATIPLAVWTLTSIATYAVWAPQLAGVGWVLPGWVEPLEYGLVAASGAWFWLHRRGRGGAARSGTIDNRPSRGDDRNIGLPGPGRDGRRQPRPGVSKE